MRVFVLRSHYSYPNLKGFSSVVRLIRYFFSLNWGLSIKTILVGLVLALGTFHLIVFVQTLLDLFAQIRKGDKMGSGQVNCLELKVIDPIEGPYLGLYRSF